MKFQTPILLNRFHPVFRKPLILFALLLVCSTTFGQAYFKMHEVNTQLRGIFTPLNRPNPDINHLYDMSYHIVEEPFFATHSYDTSSTENFYRLVEEMRQAAFDSTTVPSSDTIYRHVLDYRGDTVPMLLFDKRTYFLTGDALTTPNYFTFDLNNDLLYDIPNRPMEPYLDSGVFAGATGIPRTSSKRTTFRIDPHFMFLDTILLDSIYKSPNVFEIDFGDGQGFIPFSLDSITHHAVTYPTSGQKIVQYRMRNPVNQILRYAVAAYYVIFPVGGGNAGRAPDQTMDLPGMRVGIYHSCQDEDEPLARKTLFLLEGWDAFDMIPGLNTDASDVYGDMIQQDSLQQLIDYGYEVVVVDWKESGADIRQNAMYFVSLLNTWKCGSSDLQPFVVAGHSMGGLVARYALTYMETTAYTHPLSGNCWPAKKHNTRLLITIDSPHQGANVPLSLQALYRTVFSAVPKPFAGTIQTAELSSLNMLLGSTAAKQMLIYHYDTRNPFANGTQYDEYSEHPFRTQFMDALRGLNPGAPNPGYPESCKLMALSNGSMEGNMQTRDWNTANRTPGDDLLDFEGEIYIRILGTNIKVMGADLELKTNSAANHRFYRLEAGHWWIRVKFHWFGVKINIGTNSLISIERFSTGVQPHCVHAGGVIRGFKTMSSNAQFSSESHLEGLFTMTRTNNGNGTYTFDARVGLPWIGGGAAYSIHSDGFHWGFIPLASALDYNSTALPLNIDGMAPGARMNGTPFDVIGGLSEDLIGAAGINVYHHNWHHNNLLNPSVNIPENNGCIAHREFLINTEIGERELYLSNLRLSWRADYETPTDIIFMNINDPTTWNPFYEYPNGFPVGFRNTRSYYSEDEPYTLLSGAHLHVNFENSILGGGPVMLGGNFYQNQQNFTVCCNPQKSSGEEEVLWLNEADETSTWKVYPNPLSGEWITIEGLNTSEEDMRVRILDGLGRVVLETTFTPQGQNTASINVAPILSSSGLYILQIEQSGQAQSQRIMVP